MAKLNEGEINVAAPTLVRHFRQILLWPLELAPLPPGCGFRNHWDVLAEKREDNPWREVADQFLSLIHI